MGNHTGITWVWKTKEQKENDIQKYFHKSEIPEIERRIKQTEEAINVCENRIKQLIRPVLQEEIIYTKNKAKEVKEKIKKVQTKIILLKAKRRGREDRKEIKEIKKWLEYEKELLTEEQMVDIIKRGL